MPKQGNFSGIFDKNLKQKLDKIVQFPLSRDLGRVKLVVNAEQKTEKRSPYRTTTRNKAQQSQISESKRKVEEGREIAP